MEELIKYVKATKIYYGKPVRTKYLNAEVEAVLKQYDLTLQELCYRIKYDIPLDKKFTCACCGKPIKFSPKHHYSKFCSKQCTGKITGADKERRARTAETMKKLYGTTNFRVTKEYDERARATHAKRKQEHYEEVKDLLVEYNLSIEEYDHRIRHNIPLDKIFTCELCGKKIEYNKRSHSYSRFCCHKCANRVTTSSNNFKEKTVQSWKLRKEQKFIKEYEQLKDLMQQYNLTLDECKYRLKNNIPLDKVFICEYCGKPVKFTKKHKYGRFCNNICSTKFTANQPEVQAKIRATIRNKLGVDYVSQSEVIQQKIYITKKKNNTHNVSEAENTAGDLLKQKFPDLKRQFKSKLYPFNCDFYIPSQDLYIEFNGFWTHGREPYDPNNPDHINLLNFWEKKAKEVNFKGQNKDSYLQAIHTWTVKDPLKVKTAKQNNLNFRVFWTVEEVKDWLASLK